jgi:hypothetical protein
MAAQPNAADGAQAHARRARRVMAARLGFARRQELRSVDEDEVAHGAFDSVEAYVGAAALAIAALAAERKPRKQRKEP